MTLAPPFYTPTMARLFAEQGYLRKAAEIYRQLLAHEPQRDDLRQALAALERQLAEQPAPSRKDTEMMLREWAQMLKQTHPKKRNNRARS
ncbi:MAG: hypothetical protein HZB87_01380 [Desulfatitalea sp.]|nr:hypothetical protein [Desulfatitalea sp.]MBI5895505.1 hypothetical protein [Desulfobacterales bacterium]